MNRYYNGEDKNMTLKIKKLPLAAGILSASLLFTSACGSDNESGAENSSSNGDQVVVDIFQ